MLQFVRLFTCAAAIVVLSPVAVAQQAPIGGHHGGGGGAGPSQSGAFAQSVPFSVPPERHGLPVPLALAYDGPAPWGRVVSAGASVLVRDPGPQLEPAASSVRDQLGRAGGGDPNDARARRRGDCSRASSSTGVYHPIVGNQSLELRHESDSLWRLDDGAGNEYRFERDPRMGDDTTWLLKEIVGSKGIGSRVELEYGVTAVELPDGVVAPELTLDAIRYNFVWDTGCAKNEIRLAYAQTRRTSARQTSRRGCSPTSSSATTCAFAPSFSTMSASTRTATAVSTRASSSAATRSPIRPTRIR